MYAHPLWLKIHLVLHFVLLSSFVALCLLWSFAMMQDLLQWASQRGGHHQRAWAQEALGAGGAQPGGVTCALSNLLLEMWAMKSLSAIEVLTSCIL